MFAAASLAAMGGVGAAPVVPNRGTSQGSAAVAACQMRHVTLAPADSVYSALRHQGITAGSVMRWLATDRNADTLRRVHAGDSLAFCAVDTLGGGRVLRSLTWTHRGHAVSLSGPPAVHDGIAQVALTVRHSLGNALRRHHVRARLADVIHAFVRKDRQLPDHLPRGTHVLAVFAGTVNDPQQRLLCVDVALHGQDHRIFHFVDDAGHQYVMDESGRGLRVLSMETPLRHARISSGWGWRINPVLHRKEFHKGIDFAAALGTPIRAAMGGVVDLAAWHGNYGRLVEIRHPDGLATRYGHMHRFARGIHPGSRVHAGQVIGYVGTTGLSTGPHLYFELWEHHRRVDPLVSVPTEPVHLRATERREFESYVHRLDQRLTLG